MDLDYKKLKISRLKDDHDFTGFDCGNKDLNSFLIDDSKQYQKGLFAVTYLIYYNDELVAFYSLLNDKVSLGEYSQSSQKVIKGTLPKEKNKRHKSFPAVKIGRLGVAKRYRRQGFGETIVKYLKWNFINNNKTGCRLITVDAYNDDEVISFYEKTGFIKLRHRNTDPEKEETIPMIQDLMKYIKPE